MLNYKNTFNIEDLKKAFNAGEIYSISMRHWWAAISKNPECKCEAVDWEEYKRGLGINE